MAERKLGLGITDKLYWRPVAGRFHCFKKTSDGYISLCGEHHRSHSGGQVMARPPAILRCARCDIEEMGRREVDESMPCTNEDWKLFR